MIRFAILFLALGSYASGYVLPSSFLFRTPNPLRATTAEDFSGTFPPLKARAFEEALQFLHDAPLESDIVKGNGSSMKLMEATFRVLDEEVGRDTLTKEQEAIVADLWRALKMMYNGSSRVDAVKFRSPPAGQDKNYVRAYSMVVDLLDPVKSEKMGCDRGILERALVVLREEENGGSGAKTEAQEQVVLQLRKVCDRLAEGMDAKQAVVVTWEEREWKARDMLG